MTSAPLPTWRELARACGGGAPDDQILAAPWRRGAEAAFWFSRGAWALAAVVRWWEIAFARKAPALWFPDYFCNESTAPARAAGARLAFYPVGADLAPRWPEVRALAGTGRPDLFVLVHYFGDPADAAPARTFCTEMGALLIEDAAHALGPAPGIGELGDFVLYSPRKTLAVPDGGLLLMRETAGAAAMNAAIPGLGQRAPAPWGWLAKRLVQGMLPAPARRAVCRWRSPAFADDPPSRPPTPTPRLSPLARRLLAQAPAAIAEAAAARRRNSEALRRALTAGDGCRPLFASEPPAAAPYRLALRCDPADAARRFADLRRRGCPVESWPDLPPEVLADPSRHPDAIALRQMVLLLPVHQTLDSGTLAACCG